MAAHFGEEIDTQATSSNNIQKNIFCGILSKVEKYFNRKPFDGAKATCRYCFDCCATFSNILAVPPPTTPTLTFGVPAAL